VYSQACPGRDADGPRWDVWTSLVLAERCSPADNCEHVLKIKYLRAAWPSWRVLESHHTYCTWRPLIRPGVHACMYAATVSRSTEESIGL